MATTQEILDALHQQGIRFGVIQERIDRMVERGAYGKEVVVAVDARFETIAGFDVLSSTETPGIGDAIEDPNGYRSQFKGAPATELSLVSAGDRSAIDAQIIAVSGATYSSAAVVTGINHYLPQVKAQLQQEGLIDNDNES